LIECNSHGRTQILGCIIIITTCGFLDSIGVVEHINMLKGHVHKHHTQKQSTREDLAKQ
jgi:hypothetical protein